MMKKIMIIGATISALVIGSANTVLASSIAYCKGASSTHQFACCSNTNWNPTNQWVGASKNTISDTVLFCSEHGGGSTPSSQCSTSTVVYNSKKNYTVDGTYYSTNTSGDTKSLSEVCKAGTNSGTVNIVN